MPTTRPPKKAPATKAKKLVATKKVTKAKTTKKGPVKVVEKVVLPPRASVVPGAGLGKVVKTDLKAPVATEGGRVLKVTTLNVNGLRSADRRGFREWVGKSKPDVLCLQEIRCDEEVADPALWRPKGWEVAWHPAKQKGYAGTAVWSRPAVKAADPVVEIRFTKGTGHVRGDEEGRATGVHLPEVDVWSFYMPSGSAGPERQAWKFEFMEHAWAWLEGILASGRPALVCGDINIAHKNIDLKNWRGNQKNSGFLPEERAWMDRLLARGWRDAWREVNPDLEAYSWWSNRGQAREKDVGWRIDYVLATPGVRVRKAVVEREANLSDHAPVSVWIEV